MKVLAGIVTYNRLALLKECLTSVRQQTFTGFDILVVNNGSTDGTQEWLEQEKALITLHQANLGGAGGFYACMKYAVEHNYDYVWLMDDDGLTAPNQLELLLQGMEKYHLDWANAFVLYKDDHSRIAGNIPVRQFLQKLQATDIFYWANPFNGTLISCKAIREVGYVKKEMFIWGDEVEYEKRFVSKGFTNATIVAAEHYHPLFKTNEEWVFPLIRKGPMIDVSHSALRKYKYRNLGYLDRHYGNRKKYKKYILYYVLRLRFKDACDFARWYNLGWNDDYNTQI